MFHGVNSDLAGQPVGQVVNSGAEIDLPFKPELILRLAYFGKAVTNVAGPIFSGDMGRDVRTSHYAREIFGDRKDCSTLPRTDVEDLSIGAWRCHGQETGIRHIADVHKIATLKTVFKNQRR